jgi:hypothetical protein
VALDLATRPAATVIAAPVARTRRRRFGEPEIYFLAVAVTYAYVLLAWWLKYDLHFTIGDSLARTADAKNMLFSRDPHAAAIGIYWMPLPSLMQLPFVAILEPLHHVEFAGPVTSALFGGGAVVVLARICRDFGLSRSFAFCVAIAYAANPVVAFYAANGMSESAEFFFIAVALWGLTRFLRDDTNASAVIAAVGLAGLALSKYEAAPVILFAAVVIALVHIRRLPRGQWHETALNLSIIVAPTVFLVGVWLIYQKLIFGQFFAFLHVQQGMQHVLAPPPGVQAALHSWPATFAWVNHWVFAFFPAVVLVVLPLLLPPWRRTLVGLAVVATGALAILTTTIYLYLGDTTGGPRYFTSVIIVGVIALVAVASRLPRRSYSRWLVNPAVVFAVVVGGYTAAYAETEHGASMTGDDRFFNVVVHGVVDSTPSKQDATLKLQQAARKLDSLIGPGDRVLIDARYDFAVSLFSYKQGQIVTTSDRDYEQLVSPTGLEARIGWAIVPEGLPKQLPVDLDDAYGMVHRQTGWTQVWHNGRAEIWKRDPAQLANLAMPPRG